ncbi:MAG: His/Gly/Thr/Pro-type tRNA ligase C-terminal domain-containing protein, partial [Actinomycetota bacterium]|nr:His/Gly/Thr/Pro-type tRNA ligase C-terminal domain-containing protein [Actinomycetota bacterium]
VFFAKWVQSYRDLPLLINQWANVVRWELRPRILLRTTEFLWQEGHTAHATQADAGAYALRILRDVYEDFAVRVMGMPVLLGRKTERERFAGADTTYTIEGMMGDGKALQMGTSHELGQNFATAFDITFQSDQGVQEHAWQTSWGVSTRLIGALVMGHGDDNGLRLPPNLAPIQVVVLLVRGEDGAGERAGAITEELLSAGVRAELDDRLDTNFGRRAVEWELKGVPVRVEIGPRDLAAGTATLVRRDTGAKDAVPLDELQQRVPDTLADVQHALEAEALERREARTVDVDNADEAAEAARAGFARAPWDTIRDDEVRLAQGGVTVRCLQREDGSIPESSSESGLVAFVSRAY